MLSYGVKMLGTSLGTELMGLGVLFICAIIGGIIASRFRQPAVFGLLLVGALIGPSALNLIHNEKMVHTMAEFGAILMLFIIGLEFDISKLIKMGARTLLLGLLKFAILLFMGFEIAQILGFNTQVAMFIGVILSFGGTVVIMKVLEQKSMVHRKEVPLLIGILIIEDILAVFAITFFSGVQVHSLSLIQTFEKIGLAILILIATYLFLMKFLRKAVLLIQKNNNDDAVYTYLSLGVGALLSYFAYSIGLTPTAGAFLAGSLIASLPSAKEYGKAIHPYGLIFTSIFFISMGTMVSFEAVKANALVIFALLLTVIVGNFIAIGFLTYILASFRHEQPFFASIAMVSLGEFSLLIANEGQKLSLGVDLVSITAAVIFISALVMSMGLNLSSKLYDSTKNIFPTSMKIKLDKLSEYFRRFFDQLEIENHSTKKLSYQSKRLFILMIAEVAIFFVLRRAASLIIWNAALYSFYALSIILFSYLSYLVYRRLRAIIMTMSIILTDVGSSGNLKKCNSILNCLFLSVLMIFGATLFPFAMFLFRLNGLANIIPFLALLMGAYFIKNAIGLIHGTRQHTGLPAAFSFAEA